MGLLACLYLSIHLNPTTANCCITPNCTFENVSTALEKSYHTNASNDIVSIILVVSFEYKYLFKINGLVRKS
ncbi:hypothetical protein L798_04948 [Zootermopsis nevadensis]|uniref:Secreted protein n=1 Tax=Zootermopsis nevadensis TaxID=136037 RepID=A0A067RC19_ZOONE|nr:hypothetical protein L798_04948 [Zootermopsis nevadensis]